MHVRLANGSLDQPVPFTIQREPDGAAGNGTTADGPPSEIHPVGGYRLPFGIPTLNGGRAGVHRRPSAGAQ